MNAAGRGAAILVVATFPDIFKPVCESLRRWLGRFHVLGRYEQNRQMVRRKLLPRDWIRMGIM